MEVRIEGGMKKMVYKKGGGKDKYRKWREKERKTGESKIIPSSR